MCARRIISALCAAALAMAASLPPPASGKDSPPGPWPADPSQALAAADRGTPVGLACRSSRQDGWDLRLASLPPAVGGASQGCRQLPSGALATCAGRASPAPAAATLLSLHCLLTV